MTPFVLWAATRSSSTNLCLALGAENEPFQAGPPPSHLAWSYDHWCATGETEAVGWLCGGATSFKHIPEEFDDGFNIAIARIASEHGYRHIHLVRLDELERLVSLDVAGQLDAWWPDDAKARFTELASGTRSLNPLDVPRLIENSSRVHRSWVAVEPYLGRTLTVIAETLTNKNKCRRHPALRELLAFLELPGDRLAELDVAMRDGGQNTGRIRDLVPNTWELRQALLGHSPHESH